MQVAWPQPERYYGKVISSVSWDAVLCLLALNARFFLLILDDSPGAALLKTNVESFLRFNSAPIYGVAVSVVSSSVAVEVLAVSILPQLRFYVEGQEVGRLYGAPSYEEIQQMLDAGGALET